MNDSLIRLLILVHLAATLFMTGIIWFVQIVHYPLFVSIGSLEFPEYEQRHASRTTWVVAPPMLVEGVSALLLCWFQPQPVSTWQLWAGLALVCVIWFSTAVLQVPCHEALARGADPAIQHRLTSTNWIRTAAWSLRGMLALWITWSLMGET